MRKKTFRYILFACLACLLVAGFVLRQQFYGNAVRAGRDLYIGSRADYQSLTDSLLPRLRHHWAFGVYARRINLPETFKPGHYVLEPGTVSYTHLTLPTKRIVLFSVVAVS